jgi:hypothetical protein
MRGPKTRDVVVCRDETSPDYVTLVHHGSDVEIKNAELPGHPLVYWTPARGMVGYWGSYDVNACRQLGGACARFWAEHARVAK